LLTELGSILVLGKDHPFKDVRQDKLWGVGAKQDVHLIQVLLPLWWNGLGRMAKPHPKPTGEDPIVGTGGYISYGARRRYLLGRNIRFNRSLDFRLRCRFLCFGF